MDMMEMDVRSLFVFVFVMMSLLFDVSADGSDYEHHANPMVARKIPDKIFSDNDNSEEVPMSQLYNPNHRHLYTESAVKVQNSDTIPMYGHPEDDIVSGCSAFIDSFSVAAANYTECALKYARPIRFCQQCVEHYIRSRELYDVIMKGNPINDAGDLCSSVILNSDRVQIIVRTGTFLEKLWKDCNCDQCFEYHKLHNDTVSVKLSNETEEFNERAQQTLDCFTLHSNVSADGRTVFNSTVCEDCLYIYHDLNRQYNQLEKETKRRVCMDVVDMMNSTRSLWSTVYNCNISPGSYWPAMILSAFLCLMPAVFYGATRAHGARERRNLSQEQYLQIQDDAIGETSLPSTYIPSSAEQPT